MEINNEHLSRLEAFGLSMPVSTRFGAADFIYDGTA